MDFTRRNEIADAIVMFLRTETSLADPSLINASTRLLEMGIIDSLMAMSIVAFCEERYQCQIMADDLTEESFESALAFAELVLRLNSESQQ